MTERIINVAIDGPAGAGKSTIAKKIAKDLSYIYVDTGAMYRAMALFFIRRNVSGDDKDTIKRICDEADISIEYRDGEQVVLLGGENVNGLIRTEEVGNMASKTSAILEVRVKLTELQKKLARTNSVIMDGRDIGTAVLPNADVKVYLTADSSVRAKRRFDELTAKGENCDLKQIENDIIIRDKQDMEREISPLKKAEDATLVDSSYMSIDEVVNAIEALVREV